MIHNLVSVIRGCHVSFLPPYGPLQMMPNIVIGVDWNFYARACDMDVNAVDKADVTSITEQQYIFFRIYPLQARHTSVFIHLRSH